MSTDEGPFTVFAPVDEAFDDVNIPDAMLVGMKEFYLTMYGIVVVLFANKVK